MNYLISIDIGTSSTRSVAFSTEGKLLCKKSIGYGIHSPQPGWQEQNPEEIFQAVLITLKKVIKKMGTTPLGLSCSAAMHSVIAVNEAGEALTPCIIWADNRASEYAKQLKDSDFGQLIYRRTGTPIHPMSPLCKIAWLRDHQPEIFKAAHKFVGIKEYITFRLFGQWQIDYSLASATGLFDNQTLDWYAPALEFAGIMQSKLSELVPPTFILSNLNPDIAEQLGLETQTPFVIGASDGCLANLGALALEKGETVVTLGTSAAIRMTCDEAVYDNQERIFNYILTENRYVSGGASNNGGIVYQWFIEKFSDNKISKKQAFASIKKLRKIPAGSEGLLFLPYLTGERAPLWDAKARGAFVGVTKAHTKLHFQRAVFEGILFNVLQIGEALTESIGNTEIIYANGGLAQIDVLMQMLADIFGVQVLVQDNEEASAFGAFLLGMKAIGLIGDFADAKTMIPAGKIYLPDPANQAVYRNHFDIFKTLYPKLKPDFEKLAGRD